MKKVAFFLFCTSVLVFPVQAQDVAIKTNLLYGIGTLTPNLGVEFRLSDKTSLDVPFGYNAWTFSENRKWKHILVQPEYRWWLKETFNGSFFGAHAHYAYYNVGGLSKSLFSDYMNAHRFQGWLAGAGVSYGYRRNFSERWGMEATLGVGYAYLSYEKYKCGSCEKLGDGVKHYFGPTRAGISLIYTLGGQKKKEVILEDPIPAPTVTIVPEPKPVVVVKPTPEPVVVVSTGERLLPKHAFLAPVAEFTQAFADNSESYIAEHRDGSLSLYFEQSATRVDPAYMNNESTIRELLSVIDEIQRSPDSRVARVVVAGFSSPEGSAALNERLANDRAVCIKDYLVQNSSLSSQMFDVQNGGIDWQGLRKLVAQSSMPEKNQIMYIIDNMPVWDSVKKVGRHGELMRLNGGKPYKYMMANFFPELRNATYIRVYFDNK